MNKQKYKSIEGRLGSKYIYHVGLSGIINFVDQTIGRANSKAKLNRSLLLLAASKGDVVQIISLLKDGVDVNTRKGVTAHFAEALGNVFPYTENAYTPSYSLTPLHFAALNGHVKVVELLIRNGADVNAKDDSGLTPLHLASGGGYEEIVKLLFTSRAHINAKDSKDVAPLHFAAEGGYLNIVQLLISEGAKVNAKTKSFDFEDEIGDGFFSKHHVGIWTPLHFAIKNWHLDLTKVLLSIAVTLKGDYIGPLSLMDEETFLEAVKLIMYMDKNVIKLGQDNYQKIFDLGIERNSPEIVKVLLRKDVNVNLEYQDGTTPLFRSVRCHSSDSESSLEIVRMLLENGADTNFVDNKGRTYLDYTIMEKHDGGFIEPEISNRKYADNLIGLLLENGCSKHTLSKSICLVKGSDPFMLGSLKLLVRHYLVEQTQYVRAKPKSLKNTAALSDYWDNCIAERVKMKGESFGHGLLLYNILIEKDLNKVALYTKNKNLVKYCESDACKDAYPIYKDLIVTKLSHYKKRAELLDKLNRLTIHKGDLTLNVDCQLNIVKYLPDNDLYNLVRAAVL